MSGLIDMLTGLASGGGPYAWLAGIGVVILGALGLYFKGRADKGRAVKLDKAEDDLAAHERMNDVADTSGLSDDERRERLRRLGEQLGKR